MAAVATTFGLLILFSSSWKVDADFRTASVYCKSEKCIHVFDKLDLSATAYGVYNDTISETGWGILNISAGHGDKASNKDIMFASGYLEGILTQRRIYQNYLNLGDYFNTRLKNSTQATAALKKFFLEQDAYMREMIEKYIPSNPYWRHVSYILAQYDGLVRGYGAVAPSEEQLEIYAFQLLNGNGDLLDLVNKVSPKDQEDWRTMSKDEVLSLVARNGHCSALIKVLGAYEDVYMSHSSWFIYQATMRIYKHYDFNVDDVSTAAKRISFSSYAGFLESLDDFYLLSSGMVMLQTTNSIFNMSLYELVKPQSLLAWQRVRVANMMSHSGREWAMNLAEQNSGTYNNQYMVIDLKQIQLNYTINDNALWVVEQIPGLVDYGDVTPILREGYWPSYNVPFFDEIYKRSGYPEVVKKHGTDFSYQLAPRAKIFRRDQATVKDMPTMKKIMRYNVSYFGFITDDITTKGSDEPAHPWSLARIRLHASNYKKDPYSEHNPCNSICCRGDLMSVNPGPFGCYDTKVADYSMALNLEADIISGPTLGSGLSPFSWDSSYKESHIGLPKEYNFPFITSKPLPIPGRR